MLGRCIAACGGRQKGSATVPARPAWRISKKAKPLNNNSSNRNNNNRRRGRNNSNRGGGGGGNQGNRIDSRARGNAPQMLEKYRKLAHDASLNDDRVLTEYYLQFADHYFRVMADMQAQKAEQQAQRSPRRDGEDGEFDRDEDFDPRTRQYQPQQRAWRSEGDDVAEGVEGEPDAGDNPFSPQRRERPERPERNEPREARAPRQPREPRTERAPEQSEERTPDRSEEREPREPRARKPRRRAEPEDDAPAAFDASLLPPAIARGDAEEDEAPPARKPLRVRTRRPRSDDDGGEEALEAVG